LWRNWAKRTNAAGFRSRHGFGSFFAAHIGVNLAVRPEDLSVGEFYNKGGQFAVRKLFGESLPGLLDELNLVLGE
jgi:hypothetical protein